MGETTEMGERVDDPPHLEGHHCSMVLVDVEKFGDPERMAPDQMQVRQGMYAALEQACEAAHIPWGRCQVEDRGDGVMILVAADISKNRLAAHLPDLLVAAIESHNATHESHATMRLRLALHAGEVHTDEHGHTSDSLIFAFRLLNSSEAKAALASSPGVLVVIASEWFYQNVIRHDPAAKPDSYRPVRFAIKETSASAWIRRPGTTSVTASGAQPPGQIDTGEDQLTTVLRTSSSGARRQPALSVLVDRLLAIPTVAQEAGRRLLMDHLRSEIANAVPYFPQARHHVFSLVRTCLNYPGGVEELLSVIRLLEGESSPIRHLNETVADLLAQRDD